MVLTLSRRDLLAGGMALGALAALPAWARGPARYPAPTRELMVPVEGGRIYVRVNGNLAGPKPPLVILHGGPGGTHGAYLDALALADERAVILYDQLDSGRSDWPQDPKNWRVARFVDEIERVAQALGIARWHVLGHSWGGTLALEYGARAPARLQSLVLASPLISTKSWIADADALRRELPAPVRAELARCQPLPAPLPPSCEAATNAFYAAFNGREPPSDGMRAYRSPADRGYNDRLYRTMWGPSEFVVTGSLGDYDGEPLLAKLDGPRTLFVSGQHDEARPETLAAFAARVPGAEYAVVPGAAHGFFNDRPVETLGLLRGWMQRHDAAGAQPMIIAVDGPAASGKGTIARALARHYGLPHLDTGLLYRAVAANVRAHELDPTKEADAVAACDFDERLLASPALREDDVGALASIVSAHPLVRSALLQRQRRFAAQPGGAVLDGRDIGTVIAPDADAKLFVKATPQVRARRRHAELAARGTPVSFNKVFADIRDRDARDSGRSTAPLMQAANAAPLDTSLLSIEASIARAIELVEAQAGAGSGR